MKWTLKNFSGEKAKGNVTLFFDKGEYGRFDRFMHINEIKEMREILIDSDSGYKGLIPFAFDGSDSVYCFDYRNSQEN
ncbi:SMI1/KNR4 family protein [Paludifilum halophilum]|uniref:Knr4/Smi1-like domain-containing protein n=1 Tax=Paludifilum halophilum TaxID=1642702 RepID=A0A235B467_9BACL|nr:SMI1/KNR4 family protein [Paludifilum halophilum]OYD07116.1 hypothetical protein CHM34_12010 [Paludifilum halophilum]